MRGWVLWAILVSGVVCAAVGTAVLQESSGAASFGWTAYAPLSDVTYRPLANGWVLASALVALGAGTVGAAATALILRRRAGTTSS